jgi:hypothetical protein
MAWHADPLPDIPPKPTPSALRLCEVRRRAPRQQFAEAVNLSCVALDKLEPARRARVLIMDRGIVAASAAIVRRLVPGRKASRTMSEIVRGHEKIPVWPGLGLRWWPVKVTVHRVSSGVLAPRAVTVAVRSSHCTGWVACVEICAGTYGHHRCLP